MPRSSTAGARSRWPGRRSVMPAPASVSTPTNQFSIRFVRCCRPAASSPCSPIAAFCTSNSSAMRSSTLVQVRHHAPRAVEQLRPAGGHAHFYHNVAIFGTALGSLHLVVAQPADVPTDPWYIASDQPTSRQTLDEYGLRFDIEETFLDDKSGGFQVQTSELQTPEALERLFLILALATLHFTSIGLEVVRADVRRWVDTHWDRGLSYFKIGWRWLVQQYRLAWQVFTTFWLDPAPDPTPAIASRRQAALPGRQWRVVYIC